MGLLFSSKGRRASKGVYFLGATLVLNICRYINHNNIPISEQFFPNMGMQTLETGHWGAC